LVNIKIKVLIFVFVITQNTKHYITGQHSRTCGFGREVNKTTSSLRLLDRDSGIWSCLFWQKFTDEMINFYIPYIVRYIRDSSADLGTIYAELIYSNIMYTRYT